jgi:hypothetical protein
MQLEDSSGKMLGKSHLNQSAGHGAYVCKPRHMGGVGRRTVVQAGMGKSIRSYLKNN